MRAVVNVELLLIFVLETFGARYAEAEEQAVISRDSHGDLWDIESAGRDDARFDDASVRNILRLCPRDTFFRRYDDVRVAHRIGASEVAVRVKTDLNFLLIF